MSQPSTNVAQGARASSRVEELASRGEVVLATIEALRALPTLAGGERADLLSNLAVLRHVDQDFVGAEALLKAALALEPDHVSAQENLSALRRSPRRAPGASVDVERIAGATLHPWVVKALEAADKACGLAGRDVIEVGGCAPKSATRAFGVRSWTSCDLRAKDGGSIEPGHRALSCDARALPFREESFDTAFSVCAFEHFQGIEAVLAELNRVLRPGGRLFTQFAPIWSSANGHHLWILDGDRPKLTFNDHALPPWGHLLLEEHELRHFLELTRGVEIANRVAYHVAKSTYVNRQFEGDFRRAVSASGFEVEVYDRWGRSGALTPELELELCARHPGGGDFSANGLVWVLRKRRTTT